jgi:hypothetical protein
MHKNKRGNSSSGTSACLTSVSHGSQQVNLGMEKEEQIQENQKQVDLPTSQSTYYFSNFNIFGILDRRCVMRRVYLSEHLADVCGEDILHQADQVLPSVSRKTTPNCNSALNKQDFLKMCYLTWVEDQFKSDTANYKSKMLSCNSMEYYQSSNVTQFVDTYSLTTACSEHVRGS